MNRAKSKKALKREASKLRRASAKATATWADEPEIDSDGSPRSEEDEFAPRVVFEVSRPTFPPSISAGFASSAGNREGDLGDGGGCSFVSGPL